MPPAKRPRGANRPRRANAQAIEELRNLFHWHGIPPSARHSILQKVAKEEGWIPPWEREEQRQQQKQKKRLAGKTSGRSRAALAEIRRSLVRITREGLTPEQRREPYADNSIDALCQRYRNLLHENTGSRGPLDPLVPLILESLSGADRQRLRKASRETLIKDLKLIRRARGIKRQVKSA